MKNCDNKEMTLLAPKSEDLLTLMTDKRGYLTSTAANPSRYSASTISIDDADDQFLFLHDSKRSYATITVAISDALQFMFADATQTRKAI